MPNQLEQLDQVFQALADGTRRAVIKHLAGGPASVSDLAKPFEMALPSFMQHLSVLESCKLVRSEKSGRVRIYHLTPQPLKSAEGWMEKQRNMWERRLDQLDAYLLELKEKTNEPKKR
ncbi:MAG: metalloregulator ArsR/SmtB family transcription factor [Spirochaetia bacterium]|nr:metalloregulator ArsR/SmtB family transcription factor [Spirochaetia bacterium]